MNFFKQKRKAELDHEEDSKLVQPNKKSRMVSLVKKVGQGIRNKIAVAVKALTSRTYTQEVPSSLFTTPAGPLRSARYIMTPLEPFSVKKASLEWRYVRGLSDNSILKIIFLRVCVCFLIQFFLISLYRQKSYYVYDSVIPVTESRHHEFKTGGGNYPITILPEV